MFQISIKASISISVIEKESICLLGVGEFGHHQTQLPSIFLIKGDGWKNQNQAFDRGTSHHKSFDVL